MVPVLYIIIVLNPLYVYGHYTTATFLPMYISMQCSQTIQAPSPNNALQLPGPHIHEWLQDIHVILGISPFGYARRTRWIY